MTNHDSKFFQSIEDPLIVIDKGYRILYINQSGAAIFGKNNNYLKDETCYKQFHGIDEPCLSCPMEQVFVFEKTSVSKRWVTLQDGKRRCGEIRSYPVFDASDNVVAATTIIVDITEKEEVRKIGGAHDRSQFSLSNREKQILKLISKGYTNPNISKELGISINTVKTHIVNTFNKIGVSDRTQAAIIALKAELI